jgi:hypothetical protein
MSIDSVLLGNRAFPDYYNASFRSVLEDHLGYFRSSANTKRITIDPALALQNEYDLYGLLRTISVPFHLHWLVMRLINLHSPMDATRKLTYILMPDQNEVELIRNIHVTNQSK